MSYVVGFQNWRDQLSVLDFSQAKENLKKYKAWTRSEPWPAKPHQSHSPVQIKPLPHKYCTSYLLLWWGFCRYLFPQNGKCCYMSISSRLFNSFTLHKLWHTKQRTAETHIQILKQRHRIKQPLRTHGFWGNISLLHFLVVRFVILMI